MSETMLMILIGLPLAAGLLALPLKKHLGGAKEILAVGAALANLLLALSLFGKELTLDLPWAGYGMNFTLRLYHFSGFIVLAAACFAVLVTVYSAVFMRGKACLNQFYAYLLITVGMANGAVLADNLVLLLFFWEGMLGTTFGLIAIGRAGAFKTATKALIIAGVTDLCLMAGIGLLGWLAHAQLNLPWEKALNMSALGEKHLGVNGMVAGLAFVLMMIGAISKAGSMPFHSWIPDAAVDAPLPFMAFLPGALEKLLGIYLLSRITLDLFVVEPLSWMSYTMMTIGALTILLAVSMALIQKDYKRLLSYHAISQVGYMILGVGTGTAIGIVGGLFHMVNNAIYKSGLFMTGGAVEYRTGTTDLNKVGGLGRKMPITFACYLVMAAAISGVPPFNGFFSKELVYAGALKNGTVFYVAAVLGSFLTAASFLKLGHAAYLGKRNAEHESVKEAPVIMLLPMIVLAALCVLFGLYNVLPVKMLIEPVLGAERMAEHPGGFSGFHLDVFLFGMTGIALLGALVNHLIGVRSGGSGLKAADHIHHAPVLSWIYDRAEQRWFDPYNLGMALMNGISRLSWWIDRGIDFVYETAATGASLGCGAVISRVHSGSYSTYVVWALVGAAAILLFAMGYM